MSSRRQVRQWFLRALALVHLVAFLSLGAQIPVLIGSDGLVPATRFLTAYRERVPWWELPTIFWWGDSDWLLRTAAAAGAVLSLGLLFGFAPRVLLLMLWALYLSFVSAGQEFFAFQWDNLLLEATFFSLFLAPLQGRALRHSEPHPAAVFLMKMLVVRLHVESGLAKLFSGDPSWRDLTAMATYYETAPLPTWVGWYAHQLPLAVHRATSLLVLVVELLLPWGLFGPRPFRRFAVAGLAALQCGILLTANYGFFNYLTLALCLWGLDDDDLRAIGLAPKGLVANTARATQGHWLRGASCWIAALALLGLSVLPFFAFVPGLRAQATGLRRVMEPWRTLNAYHLFASMTYVRREVVLERSDDGATWEELHFRYKPGDPAVAPAFVAPHQPRVDFQLWFLLLRGEPRAAYFFVLLHRLFNKPASVAELFLESEMVLRPPRFLRLKIYRYRFTDWRMGWERGRWWHREWIGSSEPIRAEQLQSALP